MKIVDLSQAIYSGMKVYPGDPGVAAATSGSYEVDGWKGAIMNRRQREVLLYSIAMIGALTASLYISPVWGGAVLFWLGLAAAVFFFFALLGTAFGQKIDR